MKLKLQTIAAAVGLALAGGSYAACTPNDPVFSIEAPMTAIVDNGNGTVSITAMGVTFTTDPAATFDTPTASLTLANFVDPTPFPGRSQPGFLGATVIAEGCVLGGAPVAEAVFSDVSENVLLGTTTSAVPFRVLGAEIIPLTDPRMPSTGITRLGIPVDPATVPLGSFTAVEGYAAQTDPSQVYAFAIDTAGGDPLQNIPQTGISEWRCTQDVGDFKLRVIGGSFEPAPAVAGGQIVTIVDANLETRVFGSVITVPTVPASQFSEYVFNGDGIGNCPLAITVLNNNGSRATTLVGTPPPPSTPAIAVADSYSVAEDTVGGLVVDALNGVLANDTDAENDPLTAELVTGPATGALTLNADGSFTYEPDLNFNGVVTFTYRATQLSADPSNTVTVTINVTPVNDAPVAAPDAASTILGQPIRIFVLNNDTDVDLPNDTLGIQLGTDVPADANVITGVDPLNNLPFIEVTPSVAGTVNFSYQAVDAAGALSNPVNVSVQVIATETLSVQQSVYRLTQRRWVVSGTTNVIAGQNMEMRLRRGNGTTVPFTYRDINGTLQIDQIDAAGAWIFDIRNSTTAPLAGEVLEIRSQLTGATVTAPISVRN